MPDTQPDRLSAPTNYLVRMGVFLALAAFLAFILQKEIVRAFMANPGLNGVILGVLAVGIVLAVREVARLYPEIAYVNGLADQAGTQARKPVLLAPVARLIGQDAQPLSTTTWRAVMDSIATRLDEGREILRYLTGLLIFLGLLGTFWGLLETVGSIGTVINALQGNADSTLMFEDLKNGIARPLAGMSLSFTASLFGLAGSLVMGFLDLQTGQAQSRFYTDLENIAGNARRSVSGADSISQGVSAETREVVRTRFRTPVTLRAQSSRDRRDGKRLPKASRQLVQHMRSEQQMIRNWAEAQANQHAEIRKLIDRVASEPERALMALARGRRASRRHRLLARLRRCTIDDAAHLRVSHHDIHDCAVLPVARRYRQGCCPRQAQQADRGTELPAGNRKELARAEPTPHLASRRLSALAEQCAAAKTSSLRADLPAASETAPSAGAGTREQRLPKGDRDAARSRRRSGRSHRSTF